MSEQNTARPTGAPDYLIVGQVVAPFGVKGELKVDILTEFPHRFRRLEQVTLAPFSYIPPGLAPSVALNPATVWQAGAGAGPGSGTAAGTTPAGPTVYAIEGTRMHKGQLILKLKGVDTVNDAESLRGCWVLVPREQAHQLPAGSYYIYQIVGLNVYTTDGRYIGEVADVLTTTANDVYIVKGPGVHDPSGELLVPAIKSVVHRIDPRHERIVIAPPEEWM
jgi:16S rRNA processing protein RimM